MTELLSKDQFSILTVDEVELLVGDHFLDSLIQFGTWLHSLLDIIRELLSNLLTNSFKELGFNTGKDSQKRSLSPFKSKLSSHFDGVFLNILVKDLAVELRW